MVLVAKRSLNVPKPICGAGLHPMVRYHDIGSRKRGLFMDMAAFARESALNRQAFEQLREQIRRQFVGKYVLLTGGKVLGAADSFDAARALLDKLEVVPEYYL